MKRVDVEQNFIGKPGGNKRASFVDIAIYNIILAGDLKEGKHITNSSTSPLMVFRVILG